MSRKVKIVKVNPEPAKGTNVNPSQLGQYSAKHQVTESAMLNKYLSSRGINPAFVSKDTKVSHAKSNAFKSWLQQHQFEEVQTEETLLEDAMLDKYLSSRGINPEHISTNLKVSYAKSAQFLKWKQDHMHEQVQEDITKGKDDGDARSKNVDSPTAQRQKELEKSSKHHTIKPVKSHADKHVLKKEGSQVTALTPDSIELEEVNKPSALERFRKASAEREQKHKEIEKKQSKDGSGMTSAIDRLQKHLNKEDTLDEVKHYPYRYRATYHDSDTNKMTHVMDFSHKSLEAAKKHAEGSRLQRKDGKEDKLHSVEQIKEEQIDELNYDTVSSLYSKRRAMRDEPSKKSKEVKVQNVKTSISRMAGHKATQNQPFNKVDKGTHYELVPKEEVSQSKVTKFHAKLDKLVHSTFGKRKNEEVELDEANITHAAHFDDPKTGKWASMALLTAKDDKDAVAQAHDLLRTDAYRNYKLSAVEKHEPIKNIKVEEEVEQIDELKKSTVKSWLGKQDVVPPKKPGMDRKAHNLRIKTRSKSWDSALDRLTGHKPTSEDIMDPQAAIAKVPDTDPSITERKRELSKSARMIKALYKSKRMVKEDLYDHEKEDKSVVTYGKKPKFDKADKDDNVGEKKSSAAAIMSGGTTLTGQERDDVEIDPAMRNRPGQPDVTKKDDKKDKKEDKK
jgi:hypothetical protein